MSPRTPKAVREHQGRRRAELMVLQRAREYHTAVIGAELVMVLLDQAYAAPPPGRVDPQEKALASMAAVELASRMLEAQSIRYAELCPRRRRRGRR